MKYFVSTCFVILLFYNVKNGLADEHLLECIDLTRQYSVIYLDTAMFIRLVQNPKKRYEFSVLFIDDGCKSCPKLLKEFQTMAKKYTKLKSYRYELFFGVVDFNNKGKNVFKLLEINSTPKIRYFSSDGKYEDLNLKLMKSKEAKAVAKIEDMDQDEDMAEEEHMVEAEDMAEADGMVGYIVQLLSDVTIQISSFLNATTITIILFTILIGFLATFLLFVYKRTKNLGFLCISEMWAVEAVLFCLFIISGQLWNELNGSPLYEDTNQGPMFFSAEHMEQFWIESILVAFLFGGVVVGMIIIIEASGGAKGPKVFGKITMNGDRRRTRSIIGTIFVCVSFSYLLFIFRRFKLPIYPFHFIM